MMLTTITITIWAVLVPPIALNASVNGPSEELPLLNSVKENVVLVVPPKSPSLFVRAFDMRNALEDLIKPAPLSLRAFDGIRVIAIVWIVLGHTLTFNIRGFDNPTIVRNARSNGEAFILTFIAVALRNVDTFLFLSGVLLAFLVAKKLLKSESLKFGILESLWIILNRFLRLTPIYLVWLLVWWQLLPRYATGPFSHRISDQIELCNKYWFSNLFYFSNFYPASFDDMCFGWSWYLSVDFQLFLFLGPLLLFSFFFFSRRKLSMTIFSAVSILPLLVISLAYRLWAVLGNENVSYLASNYMDLVYSKPYSRAPPFVIGMWVGFLLSRRRNVKLSALFKWLMHVATFGGFVACSVPLYYLSVVSDSDKYHVLSAVYAAYFPFVWSMSLAWLTISIFDRTWPGQTFLELAFWAPLGKLGLSVYLIHPIIVSAKLYELVRLPTFSNTWISDQLVANVVISYLAALAAYLTIEYPLAIFTKSLLAKMQTPAK